MLIGAIGPILFHVTREQVFTFKDLALSRSIRFAEHKTLEGLAKLQHTGRELDSLSLNVVLASPSPSVVMMDALIASLLLLAGSGEEYPLVFGIRYWGMWVIESAVVNYKEFHGGKTWNAEVALTLKEYN